VTNLSMPFHFVSYNRKPLMMAWLVMISIQCRVNAVRIKMLVSVTMPFKNQSLMIKPAYIRTEDT